MWLEHGKLAVKSGTLVFSAAGGSALAPGNYELPYQMLNALLLGPGTQISHDALRLMARHGTGFVAVGSDGVRSYASSMPKGPDQSKLARAQARLWASESSRWAVARKMFERRFGEEVDELSLNQLRGAEAARVKAAYRIAAQRHGLVWKGRRYDRANPEGADDINRALNHATVALLSAAKTAVAIAGAIPQLGFVHEDSGWSFCLDIADLHRETIALEGAFSSVVLHRQQGGELERVVRKTTGMLIRKTALIAKMIDDIKEFVDGSCGDE